MRRWPLKPTNIIPGQDTALTLRLTRETATPDPVPDCEPAITGLFWFSEASGLYDQDVEASYLLTEGAAGPVLGVAGLVGEDCRLPVTWTKTWTPASGTDGDPGYFEDGARLVVYPLATSNPGVLEVTAEHDGKTYGPILLTVVKYACYAYSTTTNAIGGWLRLTDSYPYASYSGPLNWYGTNDGSISIGANNVTTINFSAIPATQVWIYCNDGGSGYYKINGDGITRYPQRGTFSPPWSGSGTPISITNLTSLELHSDGYGSPWYVFIK